MSTLLRWFPVRKSHFHVFGSFSSTGLILLRILAPFCRASRGICMHAKASNGHRTYFLKVLVQPQTEQ